MGWDFSEIFIVCISNYLTTLLEEIRNEIRCARIEVPHLKLTF